MLPLDHSSSVQSERRGWYTRNYLAAQTDKLNWHLNSKHNVDILMAIFLMIILYVCRYDNMIFIAQK